MSNPVIALDKSVSRVLNEWGARETVLVKFLSEYLVLVVIILSFLWLAYRVYEKNKPLTDLRLVLKDLILQGVTLLVVPVGVATAISEVISRFYLRQRPFVVMHEIRLLVPHSADGGMPSHHMVFMVSIAIMVFHFSKKLGILLIVLSLISGIARISAGIHYPSVVLAGALIGGVLAITYVRTILRSGNNLPILR